MQKGKSLHLKGRVIGQKIVSVWAGPVPLDNQVSRKDSLYPMDFPIY